MLRYAIVLAAAAVTVPFGASAQPTAFRCPDQGVRVERSDSTQIGYRGADATAPLVCTDMMGASRFLGYWRTGDAFYRNGRDALVQAFTEAGSGPSRPVDIRYFGMNRTNESISVWETWQLLGPERVSVLAGTFDTTKVERRFWIVGTTYRYTETVWIDRATGVPVKSAVEHLNAVMSPDVVNWQAINIVRTRRDMS